MNPTKIGLRDEFTLSDPGLIGDSLTISFNQEKDVAETDASSFTTNHSAVISSTVDTNADSSHSAESDRPHTSLSPSTEFELAVDATTIHDCIPIQTINDPFSLSHLNELKVTLSSTSNGTECLFVSPSVSSSLNQNMVSSANVETGVNSSKLGAPIRPPPFRPRTSSNLVAASDIHAILDSFPITSSKAMNGLDSTGLSTSTSPSNKSDLLTLGDPSNFGKSLSCHVSHPPISSEIPPIDTHLLSTNSTVRKRTHSGTASECSIDHPTNTTTSNTIAHEVAQFTTPTTHQSPGSIESPATLSVVQPSGPSTCLRWYYAIIAGILLVLLYLVSPFFWGFVLGVVVTGLLVMIRDFLCSRDSTQPRCPLSDLPLGQLCCSLHCPPHHTNSTSASHHLWWPIYAPALPPLRCNTTAQLRDLPAFNVPHMTDEDPTSSTSTGPLASGLGFKLDGNERPVYRGWMNETSTYDPETHHVSRTNSVFVTLDGTQLHLQRPRRNIARRSMWNDDLPPMNGVRFQTQRIYDLTHARVALLPTGLVSKRLWSRKYPISITITLSSDLKKPTKSLSRFLKRGSTSVPNITDLNASIGEKSEPSNTATTQSSRVTTTKDDLVVDDNFTVVSHGDMSSSASVIVYLFGRTCREKESWFRRLRAASLGVPLLWTPQLAAQFLSTSSSSQPTTVSSSGDSRSDDVAEISPDSDTDHHTDKLGSTQWPLGGLINTREPSYLAYVRYMAKIMPAKWLSRGAQTLHLNVNHISCDPSLTWLNALLARMFWDFLHEAYWLERVRDRIQAKLKKIHLPGFISELLIVGINLGSELPVIRYVGHPYLDAHGLWIEVDMAYAGGFSVVLETNVNLLRWNQKNRMEWEAANLADDLSTEPSMTIFSDPTVSPRNGRSSRLGAFISDEEDSADSTTDSDCTNLDSNLTGSVHSVRRSSHSGRSMAVSTSPTSSTIAEESRSGNGESPFQLTSALPSRKRLIRIVDRITRSSYFQKAVDTKFVQRGMEMLSNTPIVLEVEVQSLSGTLLLNIPPPQSNRLWYGFKPSPQLRIKTRPRVGEKAVTMSRILEWIEKRVILEFQRLVVLPNMDDICIPLLLSDVIAGDPR